MKILLVNPKNSLADYVVIPNIGLGYLSEAIKRNNYDVDIIDTIRDSLNPDELADIVISNKYGVVGFYTSAPSVEYVKKTISKIKEQDPSIISIIGGPQITYDPVDTMNYISNADYGFMGDSEPFITKLLYLIESGNTINSEFEKINNLAWHNNNELILNEISYPEISEMPDMPNWNLLQPDRYPAAPNGIFSKEKNIAPLITSRGCNYHCNFCCSGNLKNNIIRYRDISKIKSEIELLISTYRIKEIHIMDDNFTSNRSHAIEICEMIKNLETKIVWACPNGIRLDTLDKELVSLMYESGCYSFAVGIEAGSQKILDKMNKHLTLETIEEKISLIKKHTDIKITGFFIVGYPGESEEDIKKTIDFSKKLEIDKANFFNFTPFPGSSIYNELKTAGKIDNINYKDLYIHNILFSPDGISLEYMHKLQRKAYLKFYCRPKILLGLLKEIKSFWQLKIILQRIKAIL